MEKYYISSSKFSIEERKTKLHGKVYDIRFRVITLDGKEIQKKISGFQTKALAKQGYIEFVQEHCELVKNNPLKKKTPNKDKMLVGDIVRQYMASMGNQNKYSSIYEKNQMFRIYILPKYEKTPLNKLTKEELYQWQDEVWNMRNPRTGEYFSYRYLVKIRAYFSAFLTWCEQRYGIKNYFDEVAKPKRRLPKTEMKFWNREQFERFIENITDPTYHALFTFMFYTGRRKGELFALSPADVTPTTIKINKSLTRKTATDSTYEITSTKADKSQIIPVCEVVQREIAQYKPSGAFYFGGDKPLADNTVRRVFLEYTKKANLPQIRIHDLRHSYASLLIHLSSSLWTVAELLGDEVSQITKTYGHLYKEDVISVINKIK